MLTVPWKHVSWLNTIYRKCVFLTGTNRGTFTLDFPSVYVQHQTRIHVRSRMIRPDKRSDLMDAEFSNVRNSSQLLFEVCGYFFPGRDCFVGKDFFREAVFASIIDPVVNCVNSTAVNIAFDLFGR